MGPGVKVTTTVSTENITTASMRFTDAVGIMPTTTHAQQPEGHIYLGYTRHVTPCAESSFMIHAVLRTECIVQLPAACV